VSVGPDEELRVKGTAGFNDRFPMWDDVASGSAFEFFDRDGEGFRLLTKALEAMIPMDGDAGGQKSLFQQTFQSALREDEQKGELAAQFGEMDFGVALVALIKGKTLDTPTTFDGRLGQAESIEEPQGARMQCAGIAAGGGFGLAIDQCDFQPPFGEDQGGPKAYWPRSDNQDFGLCLAHNISFFNGRPIQN